ncbi:P-loop containing nucleoside triphosphate hydrolase protein [Stemphylium lycopersici]|nr:P-loop containing nucleoside triphosphate hydrolase protein [Stemphylium lycopersici]
MVWRDKAATGRPSISTHEALHRHFFTGLLRQQLGPIRPTEYAPVPAPNEQPPAGDDLPEAVEKGDCCNRKDIYRVPTPQDPKKFHWVDEKPSHYGVVGDKSRTKKAREAFAVNIYHKFIDSADEWQIHEIKVNSKLLRVVLGAVLEGYPGLTQHSLESFSPPFLPFIHRWQALLDYKNNLDADSETKRHLELFQEVLEPILKESFDKIQAVEATGHAAFEDLNLIYIPAMMVLEHATDSVGIVRNCQFQVPPCGPTFWRVGVDVVDWDGRRCGLLAQEIRVYEYAGLRALTALEASPLEGLPEEDVVRKRLISRGRIFEKLRGHFFKAFTNEHEERVNDRVIIDARAYHKYGPSFRESNNASPYCPPHPHHDRSEFPNYAKLSEIGQLTWVQSMNRYSSAVTDTSGKPMEIDLTPMTDDQCLLAVHYVKCFNIEKKRFEKLDVTKIHDIPWAERAFDSLVLDQGEKDLVLALVDREQFKQGHSFDDFIGGKGQGMIMLLCGPPGVGKTLTAETVSEHLRRPLYKLGAGDLGTDARVVEQNLNRSLNVCGHFGAVLLIDEADVFMETRTTNNLQRNELVSVFLRLLEYYNGIMILTTNRTRSIDAAFESRIDITLTYNTLTESDRQQVWRNFLNTMDAKDVDVGEADLIKLAKWDFNGRQIKSAIKTACILATKKQEPLNASHLTLVLGLRKKALGMMDGGTSGEDTVIKGVAENGIGG